MRHFLLDIGSFALLALTLEACTSSLSDPVDWGHMDYVSAACSAEGADCHAHTSEHEEELKRGRNRGGGSRR
jgi:hypothetical protein